MKCDELKAFRALNIDEDETGMAYPKAAVDEAFDELKQVIKYKEGVGKRWFDSCMEARTLWVKNTRALWLMTAEWAEAMGLASCNIANKFMSREKFEVGEDYREKTIKKYRHRQVVFYKYADYCRAKAENPQNPQARNKKPLRRDVIRGERLDEDCKLAHITVECGKCLCYGLLDNAENTLDKCKKCKAYVWNDKDVIGIKEADK